MSSKESPSHPIKPILSSRKPAMVVLKYLLIFVAVVMGFIGLQFSTISVMRPLVYQKDFIQEWLLAKAVLGDIDPYLPLPELALRFLGPLPNSVLQHPTPHPPTVAVLSLPLGALSYEQAAGAWLVFEIVCIVAAIYLLLLWSDRRPGLVLCAFLALLALAWSPFWEELITGQLMALLLFLLIGAWLALREGRSILGGILLGLTIAVKLIAWPIIIFLVLKKNWRAVVAAGVTAVIGNLAAAALMGFDTVLHYYGEVSSAVSPLYQAYEHNFSLWTIGWRVFDGTGSLVVMGFSSPPLVNAPILARLFSYAIPLALLIVGLVLAVRAYSFDTSYCILICVSILVSPVAWWHYLVLLLVPIAIIGRRLYNLDWPKRETNIALVLGLLLVISRGQLSNIIRILAGHGPNAEKTVVVPFIVGLLSFVPAAAILGVIWLVWHLDQVFPENALEGQSSI
jgi:hypothetical protein